MKRIADILLIGLAISSCAKGAVRPSRAEAVEAIAARCNLPAGTLKLTGPDELRSLPPSDAKYESIVCALTELKKQKFPMKMGFVGNEAIAPEAK